MSEDADRAELPPDRLTALWRRLKDHRIAQWMVGYVAVAYGVQHAVALTTDALEWPHLVTRISILLLALGLPVAMTLAWYHGDRTARRISSGELAVVSVVLLGISFAFYLFVRPMEARPSASATAASALSANPKGLSLAVLPFVNLSSDKEQEFFSDGMTEEITSALAKIPKLPVVGRTSAFQFKGQSKDLSAIGQALHATYLLEGSVRKAGDRVRITAQLIRASDDFHVWTDSYDRELKDVFAVQEDVARAIAASLQVPLGLKQGESLVSNRNVDPESYQDYLRARALVRIRGPLEPGGPLTQAAKLLEQVVARDPNYAPAWSLLAQADTLIPLFTAANTNGSMNELRPIADESYSRANSATQQAIKLDPENADAYIVLGLQRVARADFFQAEDLFQRALSLDPTNPDALHFYSGMLAVVGRLKESLSMRMRLKAQEPLVPIFNEVTAIVLWDTGQSNEAAAIYKSIPPTVYSRLYLAPVYASMARYREAADALKEIPPGFFVPGALEEAVRLLRAAPAKAASADPAISNGLLGFVYLFVGMPDRSLDWFENIAERGYPVGLAGANANSYFWGPAFASVRKTERFKEYVRKAGFLPYWRTRGWPDLCHPTTGDDFECS